MEMVVLMMDQEYRLSHIHLQIPQSSVGKKTENPSPDHIPQIIKAPM
jgi:hypothetical protein